MGAAHELPWRLMSSSSSSSSSAAAAAAELPSMFV